MLPMITEKSHLQLGLVCGFVQNNQQLFHTDRYIHTLNHTIIFSHPFVPRI